VLVTSVLLGVTSFEESSWNDTDVFVMFIWLHICFVGRKQLVLKETINDDSRKLFCSQL